MELAYLFRALLRRKWIVLFSVAVALAAAIVFTRNFKKEYKSTARLATGFTVNENQGVNIPQVDLKFNNAIENITSPKVISLVSYHLMLHDLQSPEPFVRLTISEKESDEYKELNKQDAIATLSSALDSTRVLNAGVPEERRILNYLALCDYDVLSISQKLQVTRYQHTDFLNIVASTENPILSAFIVNTLCDEFKRSFGVNKRQTNDRSISNLDSLVKQKKAILDQKQSAKEQFQSSHGGALDVNMESNNKLSQISSYESELIDEKSKLQSYTYRAEQLNATINAANKQTNSSSNTDETVAANRDFIRLRRQFKDLNDIYMSKGSNDPVLKSRLDSISRQMTKLRLAEDSSTTTGKPDNLISLDQIKQDKINTEAQIQASNLKISSIESMLEQLKSGLSGMAAKGAVIEQFNKEITIASAEYTTARDQLNNALLNSTTGDNGQQGSFKQTVIGEAALAPEPSKKMLIIGMSGAAAFVLSSLVILISAFFDQSIKTPRELQRLTQLPLLGTVNRVKFKHNGILDKITLFEQNKKNRVNLFREQLRKLRFELENSHAKTFLFTSCQSRQGKTTLIEALAYSFSLVKKNVLIIDTNFSNNDLTVTFNAATVLQNFHLTDGTFNKDDIKALITKTSVEGVDIIGSEKGDYTPTEILHQDHLLNYLDNLKEDYDYIFLEGPPLNEFTDSKELAPFTDKVIAVFSAEAVLSEADKESINFFQELNDKFLGAILNKVDRHNL